MKASRLILFFGIITILCCCSVSPSKFRKQDELRKLIVSNLDSNFIKSDTIIFDSYISSCVELKKREYKTWFQPVYKDSSFREKLNNRFNQNIYFIGKIDYKLLDSNCLYEGEVDEYCFYENKTLVNIFGYSQTRKSFYLIEHYIYSNKDVAYFTKFYRIKNGKWEIWKKERMYYLEDWENRGLN